MMRPIPTWLHGILDYVMGMTLIAAPWILGFSDNQAAMMIPVTVGTVVILYSLVTSYEYGLIGLLSMTGHLTLDFLGGAILALSPWLFGFQDRIWWPHLVFGCLEVAASLLTSTVPARAAGPGHMSGANGKTVSHD